MSSDASVGFGREHAPLGASVSGAGSLSKPGEFPATIDSPVEAVSCPNPTVIGARPPEGSESVDASHSRSVAGERAVSNALTGFELLGELGRGGMGVVYKARQVGLNRLVALKMILAGSHAGEEEMLRFHREAAAVAKLQHANIVQIYEFGEHDGRPYFAFEFVDGGSLAQMLSGTPMPASAAASLAETLARAMQYAHERGIIHRDLKPANVLLQKVEGRGLRVEGTSGASKRTSAERTDTSDARGAAEGDQPRSTVASTPRSSTLNSDPPTFNPKITDFGLAKQLDMDTGQTQSGVIMGTPSYMAPEQAAGLSKDIGPAADIYSLGAILYEMLTGRPPFRAAVVLATLEQVRLQEPVAPSRLQPGLPRDLETICLKCLQKEPAKRYESAAMLADDLARFLGGEPIDARPVSRAERAWRWAKRKPALATMTAAVAVLLLAAILGPSIMLVYLNAARKESDDNARKATKNQKTAEANAITADTQRQQAVKQEGIAKAQEKLATAEKARAERLAAGLAVDRGLTLCEQNDVGAGMLWLARGLELSPADALNMQRFIRTSLSGWQDKLFSLRVVLDQGQSVVAVAWSPDGRHLVTGGWDKTAQIWNAATGERAAPPLAHTDSVRAVAFSPDGTKILTGSNDHTARLWNARSGEPIGPVLRHRDWVFAAVFRPDGKVVATGSNDLTVRLWDTASGQPIGEVLAFLKDIGSLAFSPDSKLLASVADQNSVRLSDASTGRPIGPALEHANRVSKVEFSPDGKLLATGTADGVIRCWDVATFQPVGIPMKHDNFVIKRIAFSPDGQKLATAGDGISVRLWDVATNGPLGYPLLHHRGVMSLAFGQDGRVLITASADRTARMWDIATGRPIGSLLQHPRELVAMALAPDGRTIATTGIEGTTRLWNVPQDHGTTFTHAASVRSVAISRDGSMIATASYDKSVRLWDAATGNTIGEPFVHPADVISVALSPDARLVATGCADKAARIWNRETGELIGGPLVHAGRVLSVRFAPDGNALLTGSETRTTRFWDTRTATPLRPPLNHQFLVRAVAFSRDGSRFAVASGEFVRVYNTENERELFADVRHTGPVWSVEFSSDGKRIATGSEDKTAQIWDADTGARLGPSFEHTGTVWTVAFTPDGQSLITSCLDRAQVWGISTGKPLGPPLRHGGVVWAAALSQNGKTLLTGSTLGNARLWTMPDPWTDEISQVVRRVQGLTGLELNERGAIQVLSGVAWRERSALFSSSAGPVKAAEAARSEE